MKQSLLIILFLFSSATVNADPISLRVKITKQEFSGYYPPCKTENCIQWHFWYIFEAKVINVLDGEYSDNEIRFARLQHASWGDFVLEDMYIVVDKFTNKETSKKLSSEFVASYMTFPQEVVCIPQEVTDTLPSKNKYKDLSFSKSCFYTDDLIEMNNELNEDDSE